MSTTNQTEQQATGGEVDDATAALIERNAAIAEQIAELSDALEQGKAELRARLGTGTWTHKGRPVLTVSATTRFSSEQAEAVLPPELLALCRETVVSSKLARRILPPALYSRCQAPAGKNKIEFTR